MQHGSNVVRHWRLAVVGARRHRVRRLPVHAQRDNQSVRRRRVAQHKEQQRRTRRIRVAGGGVSVGGAARRSRRRREVGGAQQQLRVRRHMRRQQRSALNARMLRRGAHEAHVRGVDVRVLVHGHAEQLRGLGGGDTRHDDVARGGQRHALLGDTRVAQPAHHHRHRIVVASQLRQRSHIIMLAERRGMRVGHLLAGALKRLHGVIAHAERKRQRVVALRRNVRRHVLPWVRHARQSLH
mmetsp:Transcript_1276/g.3688  ORF Transcript_1276/g.3688 Transcript_1276/m.3688 type:complete len:239 (-) Transcript_1276:78-794(-)